MKLLMIMTTIVALSQNAFALHSVETVTSTKKIIIPKDFDEKIEGDKIVKYKNEDSKSGEITQAVISEHALLKIGDKIKIYRTTLKFSEGKRRMIKSVEKEFIGTATVVAPDLKSDTRLVSEISNGRNHKFKTISKNFSDADIKAIERNAVVAVPDNGIEVRESDLIEL